MTAAALLKLARVENDAARYPQAEAAAREALALDPGNVEARYAAAALAEACGRPEEALTLLADSDDRGLLIEHGRIAARQHDLASALQSFQRAAAIHDDLRLRRMRWRARRQLLAGRVQEQRSRRAYDGERAVIAGLLTVMPEPSVDRDRLRIRAQQSAWRRTRAYAWLWVVGVVATVLTVALFACGFVVVHAVWPHPGTSFDVVPIVVVLAAWMAVMARFRDSQPVYAVGAVVSLALAGGLYALRDHTGYFAFWTAAIVAGSQLTLMVFIALVTALQSFVLRRVTSTDPGAAALASLLWLRDGLRGQFDASAPWEVRSGLRLLEDAASGLRDHLKGAKPTGDIRTDAWLDERADGIAAGMRDLKKWLISPGEESRLALADRVEHDIRCFVEGRWRDLAWSDPGVAAARARRLRITEFARNLAVAGLPLAALAILQWLGVSGLGTFLPLALGWAAISLLVTLDPKFTDKLSAFKDARDFLKKP